MDLSKTHTNCQIDYRTYKLNLQDLIIESGKALLFIFLTSITFYNSFILFVILSPLCIVYSFLSVKRLCIKRENKLLLEFRDAIYIISTFLSAGYSSENSFKNSIKELTYLHGKNSLMVNEINNITNGLLYGKTIESGLKNLSLRVNNQDIIDFCEVYSIAKQKGYNLTKVINNTCEIIREKIQIAQDIQSMTAQKRFEQNIMSIVPFFIIIYLNLSSPGFLNIMYTSIIGRIVMTICLIIYILSFKISQKILNIDI